MTAIPVKTDKEESAVAPLFGKAKWFALIDDEGAISFWHNELKSGREVVNHFQAVGITRVVFQDMGGNPFMLLSRAGIGCYYSGEGRVLLKDAVARLQKDELIEVTQQNMAEYVERSQRHSKGDHHEGHEHHDHGHHH
ncbi:NifB/NifX family molybdenum-iron cluster-binding protein [bacterium]|jgi:predicted Fe-Mo cluster-binding NifX family protein|nr:NifB/NifX family molybdenum-iron cluster-binding protein [bacterium]